MPHHYLLRLHQKFNYCFASTNKQTPKKKKKAVINILDTYSAYMFKFVCLDNTKHLNLKNIFFYRWIV